MAVLVLADHDLAALSPATARVVAAAAELGPVDLRRLDPDARSYWIDRTPPGPPPGSLGNQF